MPVAEKVRETATELKEDARETLEHLKEEVSELKDRMAGLMPFRRRGNLPVRSSESFTPARSSWPLEDAWMTSPWSMFDMNWPRLMAGEMEQWPRIDMTENDREFRVLAELPGVEDDDVNVTVHGDALTIRGEKRSESEERGKDYHRHECAYGSFLRTIPLPCEVQSDKVEATFRKGVLTVTLPKSREARERVRQVPVRRG